MLTGISSLSEKSLVAWTKKVNHNDFHYLFFNGDGNPLLLVLLYDNGLRTNTLLLYYVLKPAVIRKFSNSEIWLAYSLDHKLRNTTSNIIKVPRSEYGKGFVWKGGAERNCLESLIRFPFFRIPLRLFTFTSQHYSEYPGGLLNEAILISDRYNLTRHPII